MLHKELTKKSKNIAWEYTDREVSPWGGMRMMKELIDKTGSLEILGRQGLPYAKSNCGYDPLQVIESFWVSVWLGGVRFAHTSIICIDEVLKEIFHWKRVPSVSTFTRYFNRFNRENVDRIFPAFNREFFSRIQIEKMTLDLDSSVVSRYGEQEGSRKGYNPNKKGRPSHHPLMAFIADIRMVANAWMRPGNTSSSNNARHFIEETFRIIDKARIGLIRADSGFFGEKFLKYLDSMILNYIVAVRTNAILKQQILEKTNWALIEDGIEVTELNYQAGSWEKPRRMIVVRQSIRTKPKAMGKMLFADMPEYQNYRYQIYTTNLDLAPAEIWRLYRGRADSENRIKELKYDFGMKGFCLHNFYGTEAAFRMVMIAYNLMSLFRQVILKEKAQQTLSTLRFKCFALGSWIVKNGRNKVLKLSVNAKRRPWFDGLFSKLIDLSDPFLVKT